MGEQARVHVYPTVQVSTYANMHAYTYILHTTIPSSHIQHTHTHTRARMGKKAQVEIPDAPALGCAVASGAVHLPLSSPTLLPKDP